MSYGLSAFLVSPKRLMSIPGSRNQRSLDRVLEATREDLVNYDEQMCDADDPDNLTHEQPLREIFDGTHSLPNYYSRDGWAFETLCGYLGTFLNNGPFCPVSVGWEEMLDEEIEKHKIPLRFRDLTGRPPIPLPEWNDWPCVGHWTTEEIRSSTSLLSGVIPSVQNTWGREALTAVQQWFKLASEIQDGMIVGFYG